MPRCLTQFLFARTEPSLRAELAKVEDLESLLENMVAKARAAWPGIEVADEDFLGHVAQIVGGEAGEGAGGEAAKNLGPEGARALLERLFASDLFLAFACAKGNARALAQFERIYLQPASFHVRAAKMNHVDATEVEQLLREKLFVKSEDKSPKIALYAGRGPLAAWVRVAATRTALSMQRAAPKEQGESDAEALLTFAAADNPELDLLRTQYSEAFRGAFHDALLALTPEERNVLRLSVVDGLPAEAIARVFGVHRATVVRRLASAREGLFQGMRRLLAERLHLGKDEFESLMGVLLSQLDMSIQRVLAETTRRPSDA